MDRAEVRALESGIYCRLPEPMAEVCEVRSMSAFQPRISWINSTVNPGKTSWKCHLPEGSYNGGRTDLVHSDVIIASYVKKLSLHGILTDPSEVIIEMPPDEEVQQQEEKPPSSPPKHRTKQSIVIEAVSKGDNSTEAISLTTGFARNDVAAILCNAKLKGLVHVTGKKTSDRSGISNLWGIGAKRRIPPDPPVRASEPPQPSAALIVDGNKGHKKEHRTTVYLRCGGTVELSVSCDIFLLSDKDRCFVFDLVDRFAGYKSVPE